MRTELDSVIAWLFEEDTAFVIHHDWASESKYPVSIADLACNFACGPQHDSDAEGPGLAVASDQDSL